MTPKEKQVSTSSQIEKMSAQKQKKWEEKKTL